MQTERIEYIRRFILRLKSRCNGTFLFAIAFPFNKRTIFLLIRIFSAFAVSLALDTQRNTNFELLASKQQPSNNQTLFDKREHKKKIDMQLVQALAGICNLSAQLDFVVFVIHSLRQLPPCTKHYEQRDTHILAISISGPVHPQTNLFLVIFFLSFLRAVSLALCPGNNYTRNTFPLFCIITNHSPNSATYRSLFASDFCWIYEKKNQKKQFDRSALVFCYFGSYLHIRCVS